MGQVSLVLIWIGGVTGALCRYHVGRVIQRGNLFPVGTCIINISGSFAFGLLASYIATATNPHREQLVLLLGVGFCGAYTTFSTFAWETVELWQTRRRGYALLNVFGQPLIACFATWIGLISG
jgi:CrcB protein